MKTLITILLILALATPAWSSGYGYYPYHAYRSCYGAAAISPAAAIGVGALILVVVVAGVVIVQVQKRNARIRAEMLESALNANQYENYLIGLRYHNADSPYRVRPLPKKKWVEWRESQGLEVLK